MARIYRMTDRIPVKIHDITVYISPLSYGVKSECQTMVMGGKPLDAAAHALKNSLKEVKGLETLDGDDYALEFDGEQLTDGCLDELLNIYTADKMQMIAIALLNGIPKEFIDPITSAPIEGVEFVVQSSGKKSKK